MTVSNVYSITLFFLCSCCIRQTLKNFSQKVLLRSYGYEFSQCNESDELIAVLGPSVVAVNFAINISFSTVIGYVRELDFVCVITEGL